MAQSMRDAYWDKIYELAKEDKDIVIVSADFGAPSLDKFRRDFPEQYINTGISEQNAILLATGLSLAGKKPIAYAITQFITLRCFEQIRIYPCGMDLTVNIVGVGAGACYWESGPTHHSFEQLSIMRTLPNLKIINCTDNHMAKEAAIFTINSPGPKFIQLDREIIDGIYSDKIDFDKGFKYLTNKNKNIVISTGNMTKEAVDILNNSELDFGIIDIYKFPVNITSLLEELSGVKSIITLEEGVKVGGMGSYILEILSDSNIIIPVHRIALNIYGGYTGSYNYGGREEIRKEYGMGKNDIIHIIEREFNI